MGTAVVLAAYRPHEGKAEALLEIVRDHVPTLRRVGLATDRPVLLLRSRTDGTLVEIFEWATEDASSKAHGTPEVAALWGRMMEIADLPPLSELEEIRGRFPHFDPVDGVVS